MLVAMLQLLTTDEFAEWFAALDDAAAEDVATALELVERLGHERAAPGSSELLLWYQHPTMMRQEDERSLASDLASWGCFRDYAGRVIEALEAPRFMARLSRLATKDAASVLHFIKSIRVAADPRARWTLKLRHAARTARAPGPEDACAEVRSMYLAALEAAGFEATDVPAHSLALRELSRRRQAPGFRVLYGVNAERETALFVLGERLDRTFYGDSVRRAEKMWKQFLDGTLRATEPAQLR
jgi:hypothetical protein